MPCNTTQRILITVELYFTWYFCCRSCIRVLRVSVYINITCIVKKKPKRPSVQFPRRVWQCAVVVVVIIVLSNRTLSKLRVASKNVYIIEFAGRQYIRDSPSVLLNYYLQLLRSSNILDSFSMRYFIHAMYTVTLHRFSFITWLMVIVKSYLYMYNVQLLLPGTTVWDNVLPW